MKASSCAVAVLLWALCCLGASAGEAARAPAATAVRFEFETDTPDGWAVVEGDLGRFLCDRARWYDGKPFGKQGKGFLSTIETPAGPWNDGLTGMAESPVFIPSVAEMSFLVGGGNKDSVYVALCGLDGVAAVPVAAHLTDSLARIGGRTP